METVPLGLGSVKLLDYNNTNMAGLLGGADIISDVGNLTDNNSVTIVNFVGTDAIDIQQTIN
jgi:hypothetical protein